MRLLVLASDLSGEPKLGAKDKDFYEAENCSLELFKIARTPLYILFYKDK
jgi:hypothetical protein